MINVGPVGFLPRGLKKQRIEVDYNRDEIPGKIQLNQENIHHTTSNYAHSHDKKYSKTINCS